jgi:hypothetical protein
MFIACERVPTLERDVALRHDCAKYVLKCLCYELPMYEEGTKLTTGGGRNGGGGGGPFCVGDADRLRLRLC